MNISNDTLERIIIFAVNAHRGQTRKGNGLPYIIHPLGVGSIFLEIKESRYMNLLLGAMYLHDVVEDCDVSLETIAKEFGYHIAALVEELTTDKKKCKLMGKTAYLTEKMINMSNYGLRGKLADRLYNVRDMRSMPNEFKIKQKTETLDLLKNVENGRSLTKTHKILIKLIKKELK